MGEHSYFPTRQVHLVSTAGIPTNNGVTKADLLFYFKQPIVYIPSTYDVVLSCVSASIPYVWTNITMDNNTLTIMYTNTYGQLFDGSWGYGVPAMVPITYTIPVGNYNITTLITVLNETVTGFTFSYNATTHCVSVSVPHTVITLGTGINQAHYAVSGFAFTDGSLSDFLGFSVKTAFNQTDEPAVLAASNPINMIRTTSVYVELPELINESFDSRTAGQSGVICRIPVTGSPHNLLNWTNIFGTHSKLALKQINHIRIRLLSDDRQVLDLRGFTWTCTLQFSVVEARPYIEGEYLLDPPRQQP